MKLQTIIIAALLVGVVMTGMISFFNSWYVGAGSSASLDTAVYNASLATNYANTWSNQTAKLIGQSQAVPVIGGGLVLLTGVYQSLVFSTGLSSEVLIPMIYSLGSILVIPAYALSFILSIAILVALFALVNAARGGQA